MSPNESHQWPMGPNEPGLRCAINRWMAHSWPGQVSSEQHRIEIEQRSRSLERVQSQEETAVQVGPRFSRAADCRC